MYAQYIILDTVYAHLPPHVVRTLICSRRVSGVIVLAASGREGWMTGWCVHAEVCWVQPLGR